MDLRRRIGAGAGAGAGAARHPAHRRAHPAPWTRPVRWRAMACDADGGILALGVPPRSPQFPRARRIDVDDATVVPGLIDAHARQRAGHGDDGNRPHRRDRQQEVLRRLQAHARTLAPGAWLVGRGWDQNDWPGARSRPLPSWMRCFPDRPVWLSRDIGPRHGRMARRCARSAATSPAPGGPTAARSCAMRQASRPASSSTMRCCCSTRRGRRWTRRRWNTRCRWACRRRCSTTSPACTMPGISLDELRPLPAPRGPPGRCR